MPDSLQSWKRQRLNPPAETPTSSPQNRRTSNARREVDVYDDIEGAHDNPSMRQTWRYLSNDHAVERSGGADTSVVQPRKASSRKRISGRTSEASGRLISELKIQGLERTQPTSSKGRKRNMATARAVISTDEDELGSEDMSGPGQQLLLEASLVQTPLKRKRGRPRKIVSQPELMENGTMPTLSSQSKHSGQKTKELHQTPTKAHRKGLGIARRELEVIDVDDQLQQPNGYAEMTWPEFQSEAQRLNTRGNRSLLLHDTQSHADRADTQKLSEAMQSQFDLIKRVVLEKLFQKRPIPFTGLGEEYKKIYQLLEATVTVGESNSMLLIGVRGSGKTTLVNQVIRELSAEQKDNFHVVRLNGFLHTDDKLALRYIWRQLGREIDIEKDDDNGPIKSYADTLAMLLALLSHPSENRGPNSEDAVAKSVIFIMDEFDLFASHPRQTLLYNLLDIAQSKKAPIAVLGLTTRLDVTECLEKRVKSRFSHRYVYLKLPSSLSAFIEIAKAAVVLKPSELSLQERMKISPDGTRHSAKKKTQGATVSDTDFINAWNSSVTSLFGHPSFLSVHVRPIYNTTKCISTLLSSLLIPITLLTSPAFTPNAFLSSKLESVDLLQPPQSNLHLLGSLSDAALALLISACRLTILHATDVVNVSLAYSEYLSLASKARLSTLSSGAVAVGGAAGARVWGREVCKGEWERLVGLGLLVPAVGTAGGSGGMDTSMGRGGGSGMVRVDVALEEIPGALVGGLSGVMERWCKQL